MSNVEKEDDTVWLLHSNIVVLLVVCQKALNEVVAQQNNKTGVLRRSRSGKYIQSV